MNSSSTISIRWHSRAGQGAITASQALAEIMGAHGRFVQSFPEFGAEKRGAAVLVFNRISTQPLTEVAPPHEPSVAVLLDSSLVASCEVPGSVVLAGLRSGSQLLINSAQTKFEFAAGSEAKIWRVDGSTIALETIGKDIPNVPVLGALIRISGLAELDSFRAELASYLSRGLPEQVVAGNLSAFERGYREVEEA